MEAKYFTPIAISDDKKSVYVLDNIEDDRVGLYKLSLAGDSYRKIDTHKNVDITNLVMTADDRNVIAIRIDDGYPSYLLLPNSGEEAKTIGKLFDSRPDVKSEDLAAMEPIEFKSFDGRNIAGYFTPAK